MALASSVSLPYAQLIGAPLVAMIEAESLAARATADFLRSVGFVQERGEQSTDFGRLRNVVFTYLKQDVNGKDVTEQIELPLLSLLPIPLLQIRDATLEFDLKVTEVVAGQGTIDSTDKRVVLKGAYAAKRETESKTTTDAALHVKINVAQADVPVGLAKLFQVLDLGTASRPVKPEEPR